jgi:hypothetical protein
LIHFEAVHRCVSGKYIYLLLPWPLCKNQTPFSNTTTSSCSSVTSSTAEHHHRASHTTLPLTNRGAQSLNTIHLPASTITTFYLHQLRRSSTLLSNLRIWLPQHRHTLPRQTLPHQTPHQTVQHLHHQSLQYLDVAFVEPPRQQAETRYEAAPDAKSSCIVAQTLRRSIGRLTNRNAITRPSGPLATRKHPI